MLEKYYYRLIKLYKMMIYMKMMVMVMTVINNTGIIIIFMFTLEVGID